MLNAMPPSPRPRGSGRSPSMSVDRLRRKLVAVQTAPASTEEADALLRHRRDDADAEGSHGHPRRGLRHLFLAHRRGIVRTFLLCLFAYTCYLWGRRAGSRMSSLEDYVEDSEDDDDDNVHEMSIAIAVTSLRCLATPGCYPRLPCASHKDPKKIPIPAKHEEHALCVDDVVQSARGRLAQQRRTNGDGTKPCLVYSFGIAGSVEWERKMASQLGCEVYAFDPTSKFGKKAAPGVKFYKLGLKGAGDDVDVSATHSEMYSAIDPSLLRTLGEIVHLLGHEEREIDVLRLDCEGCEYGVLKELACSGESRHVKQLMVEFHFQKNLGLASEGDVLVAGEAIACLEEERWGIVSMQRSGCGPLDAQYIDPALKVVKQFFFLAYITLRRAPYPEKMMWEELRGASIAQSKVIEFEKKYRKVHGMNVQNWPSHLREMWAQYDEKLNPHLGKFDSVYKQGDLGFEEYERYPEER